MAELKGTYLEDIFGNNFDPDIPQGISSQLSTWVKVRGIEGVHLATRALYQAGKVQNGDEAVILLNERASQVVPGYLTLTDFQPTQRPDWQRRAIKSLGVGTIKPADPSRLEGTRKHTIAAELFKPPLFQPPSFLSAYPQEADDQIALVGFTVNETPPKDRQETIFDIKSALDELGRVLGEVNHRFNGSPGDMWEKYQATWPIAKMLRDSLTQLAGPAVDKLFGEDRSVERFQALSGLMELGNLALFTDAFGLFVPFKEVIVSPTYGPISAGRIDVVQIEKIDNQVPTNHQNRELDRLQNERLRHPELTKRVDLKLGTSVQRFLDFKFSRGDAKGGQQKISYEDIQAGPQGEDQNQALLYTTFAPLHVEAQRVIEGAALSGAWLDEERFSRVDLLYVFPDQPVVKHTVEANAEKRKAHLDKVARAWERAQQQAYARGVDRIIPELLMSAKRRATRTVFQAPETPDDKVRQAISLEISRYQKPRQYVDKAQIIEQATNKKGETFNLLHLDRLISAGYLGDDLSFGRSRKIRCLMPDHDDSTASLQIYLETGTFKCFGCEAGGKIAKESIPANLAQFIRFNERSLVYNPHQSLPEDMVELFRRAQELLQQAFKTDHRGQTYLREKRYLDPDLAFLYGAGLANLSVINGLMDYGYGVSELYHSGFVSFSDKIPDGRGLEPAFNHRGLTAVDYRQRFKVSTPDGVKEVESKPYAALGDNQQVRVTFPTEALVARENGDEEWVIDNFYGRATWETDKSAAHRKLSIIGSPLHGAWNMKRALESDQNVIIVQEGVLDGLSSIQLGYKPVMAMVGVNNAKILSALAKIDGREKDIAWGLDNDKTGDHKAESARNELRKLGFKGKFRDFTREFADLHPAFKAVKDMNAWLELVTLNPNSNSMWRGNF